MPWGDGTGPEGEGPMTGRAMGYCAGFNMPGHANRGWAGRGRMRGAGAPGGRGGRGFRHWYYATGLPGWARASRARDAWIAGAPTGAAPDEQKALKAQEEYLEDALKEIRERLADLEKSGGE
jgi:hypothetical protein